MLHDDIVWTGLADRDSFQNIISSVAGQITDGIGEGSGKTSHIFAYYFQHLIPVSWTSNNGEFGITGLMEYDDLDSLITCIWRIAKIERQDKQISEDAKDRYYKYLDADWKSICTLQGALKKISTFYKNNSYPDIIEMDKNGEKVPGEPWSAADKARADARQAAYDAKVQADADAKAKADADAAAAKAKAKADMITNVSTNIKPDTKDKKRAEDAWNAVSASYFNKYHDLDNVPRGHLAKLDLQLNKIEDPEKYKRRVIAFYQELLKHENDDNTASYKLNFNKTKDLYEDIYLPKL